MKKWRLIGLLILVILGILPWPITASAGTMIFGWLPLSLFYLWAVSLAAIAFSIIWAIDFLKNEAPIVEKTWFGKGGGK